MRLFVDFNSEGHHPRHLEHILSLPDGVILTSRAALQRVNQNFLHDARVQVVSLDIDPSDFLGQVAALFEYLDKNLKISSCVHLAIDDVFLHVVLKTLLRRPRVPIEGVWMSCNTFYTRQTKAPAALRFYALVGMWMLYQTLSDCPTGRRPLFRFLNEELVGWLGMVIPSAVDHIGWIPDPIDRSLNESVERASYLNDRITPVVSFLGVHNSRKGTAWAIDALQGWEGPKIHIIVAGLCKDLEAIVAASKNLPESISIEIRNEVINSDMWLEILGQSEVICAPYLNFGGSSGIVANALKNQRKVLVSDFGLLGHRMKNISASMLFSPQDRIDFVRKLQALLRETVQSEVFGAYEKYSSMASYCVAIK